MNRVARRECARVFIVGAIRAGVGTTVSPPQQFGFLPRVTGVNGRIVRGGVNFREIANVSRARDRGGRCA